MLKQLYKRKVLLLEIPAPMEPKARIQSAAAMSLKYPDEQSCRNMYVK